MKETYPLLEHELVLTQFRQELDQLFGYYENKLAEVDPNISHVLLSRWLEDEAQA